MNKSITPPKKQATTIPLSQKNSSKKSPSLKKELMTDIFVQQKLRKNRQKLTHTLDTYTMLIRSNNQIRCLQHNSIITIFCQTQNKLLCSNCVFGKVQHKFHKLSPIDKTYQKIQESVQKMKPTIQREIKMLQNIKQIVLNNLDEEIIDFQRGMEMLTFRYNEAHKLLQDTFIKAKQKCIITLQSLKVKHQTVALELNFLKDAYDIKQPLLNLDLGRLDPNHILIYHHSMLQVLTGQKKFDGNVWNAPKNQMLKLVTDEQKKILKIMSQLNNQIGKDPV